MRIAVLSGWTDGEREVSLKSGAFVSETLSNMKIEHEDFILPDHIDDFLLHRKEFDLVFPMFHGRYGEDGSIFGLLSSLGIPHTHSDGSVHSLCFDKYKTNTLIRSLWLQTAKSWIIWEWERVAASIVQQEFSGKSFFVKPNTWWSSIWAFKVTDGSQINHFIEKSKKEASGSTIVEEYLAWDEYSVGVIGNQKLQTVPIMQVSLDSGEFFDYDVKYNGIGWNEIFPEDIDESVAEELKSISKRLYKFFWCCTLSRFDFIVKQGVPYLLEVNTVPGFSAVSIIPRAWRETWNTNEELIQLMIDLTLEQWS